MEGFLRDINYMIYIRYIYHNFDNASYYEDEFGIHVVDEMSHCSLYFTYDKVIELKKDECYYLHFEFVNMHNALRLFHDFMSYIRKPIEKHVLICCSSAMTSSYLCDLLNSYADEHNENIYFDCCAYNMIEDLRHKYDYILFAPQIAYQKVNYLHISNLDVILTNDYATYNCYRIIEFVKKKVEG